MQKLVVYIACSIDGYIAAPGDDLSFLGRVEQPDEDYGYAQFMQTVGTVIIGRRTYDWVTQQVQTFPHAHLPTYVITRTPRAREGLTTFYTGNLQELVTQLKHESKGVIFCDGGGQVIHKLLQLKAVDELIISIIPVLLGNGIRLFTSGFEMQDADLLNQQTYTSGLVQLHYRLHSKP